jgi:hypothetical protein
MVTADPHWVSPEDVREILARFLPPGATAAYIQGDEFIVVWRPTGRKRSSLLVRLPRQVAVRCKVSFDDAVHRLIGACAPIFLAFRRFRLPS